MKNNIINRNNKEIFIDTKLRKTYKYIGRKNDLLKLGVFMLKNLARLN